METAPPQICLKETACLRSVRNIIKRAKLRMTDLHALGRDQNQNIRLA